MRSTRCTALSIAGLIALLAVPALAGDNNDAFVRQISPDGTLNGNTLSIDQTLAAGSTVSGITQGLVGGIPAFLLRNLAGNDPQFATQRGEGNSATLTLTGAGGRLQLLQSSNPLAPFVVGAATGNNTATVTAATAATGGVVQIGEGNAAELDLLTGATGLISQFGTNLNASLEVGAGGNGTVIQIGRNSTMAGLTVEPGASATYTQIGNNLTNPSAVEVMSTNPGNVTVTQTAW